MARRRDLPSTMMLEKRLREAIEDIAPNTIAMAYTGPAYLAENLALAVADGLSGGFQRLTLDCDGARVELILVDRRLFESDVRSSLLLEAAAGRLLLPYVALLGGDYLENWDRFYKRRKIRESLISLIMEHPELVGELLIDPKYFIHDTLLKLSHVIPQTSALIKTLDDGRGDLFKGYTDALSDLKREGIVRTRDGFLTVDKGLIDQALRQSTSVSDQVTRAQRLLSGLFKLGLGGALDLLQPLPRASLEGFLSSALGAPDLPRPDRYIHFPTATGLAPLSGSTTIDAMLAGIEGSMDVGKVQLQRFGSVLNEVYLLKYTVDGRDRRAIVKRYPNWVSLKWAPLALWTLGTQNFAVMGRSRMERECATSNLLDRNGIRVPKILETSFEDRLMLREYVEGENLARKVKAAIRRGELRKRESDLLNRVGGIVAAVHGFGATLGDCKPENFVTAGDGEPVIVDLEQGARGGNATWDLAEFLYFSGHYADPLDPIEGIVEITRSFVGGYLREGGKVERVAEAARFKYTKTFTPLTLPPVILTIAKTCRMEAK